LLFVNSYPWNSFSQNYCFEFITGIISGASGQILQNRLLQSTAILPRLIEAVTAGVKQSPRPANLGFLLELSNYVQKTSASNVELKNVVSGLCSQMQCGLFFEDQ
jgi:hypothetical protein